MAVPTSYDQDFVQWAEETAGLLEARRFDEVDWEHVLEEWWSLPKSDRRELSNRLRVLILHLLKWRFQPDRRSASWESTIRAQRQDLRELLEESPSLHRRAEEIFAKVSGDARELALVETGLKASLIPLSVFTLDQVLDESYWSD